jgi:hypothetical protein
VFGFEPICKFQILAKFVLSNGVLKFEIGWFGLVATDQRLTMVVVALQK